jgi:hypothetical protein
MKLHKFLTIFSALMISVLFFSCGSGGGGDSSSGETGTVTVSLTDAMSNKFGAVYVTIDDVQIHLKGNGNGNNSWTSVRTPNLPKTFNLYELTNGVREEIGLADIEAGDYTQMRLIIGDEPDSGINLFSEAHPHANYVIDSDDSYQELKIPSGYQTGLKIVHGFTISANQTTELILDFLAEKSVVVAGNGKKWLLKPTAKVDRAEELSIISGKVTSDEATPIEGAVVSAQQFKGFAQDDKDQVTIKASTVTDSDGYFSLFVSPDTYNIVVYLPHVVNATPYLPEFRKIDSLTAGETYTFGADGIQLQVAEDILELTGGVGISSNGTESDENDEQYASLSFRQKIDDVQLVEITSVDILSGQAYEINLPSEVYTLVAWTAGIETQTTQIYENKTENDIVF